MESQNFLKAEKFFQVPVMVAVVMLIPVLILEYSSDFDNDVAVLLNWVIWSVFLLEYSVLFFLSSSKIGFVKSHKIELFILIFSFPVVPEGFSLQDF